MRKHYRIGRRDKAQGPDDGTVSRYKDLGRLMYDYQKATRPLYQRPLYRDPRAFLALLVIILLTLLVWEAVEEEERRSSPAVPPVEERAP